LGYIYYMWEINEPLIYYKSSECMNELKDNSIQLIITSPPYGKIKNYETESQIGYFDSFNEYFNRLATVWRECYRVLEPHCKMVINVGDQYLRARDYGRYRIESISSKIISDCLLIGFDYLGDVIWQKVSTTNTTGGCSLMGSIYYPRNGLLTYDYEHILIFKKVEGQKRKVDRKVKEMSKISLSEWKKWFVGHWKIPGIQQKEHVAMFPEEIPYRIIRMFSFIGDTVLDPFLGSGTSLKIAQSLFRNGIGYEVNEDYRNVIENKLKDPQPILDFQFLLYKLYKFAESGEFKMLYDLQKQKGILFLEDENHNKVVIDYLLIDYERFDEVKQVILDELKLKFEENSFQNYIDGKGLWEEMKSYVIVLNVISTDSQNILNIIMKSKITRKYRKPIKIIILDDFIKKRSIEFLFTES
jgi:DNA modification methylase